MAIRMVLYSPVTAIAITDSPKLLRETAQTERYDKGPDRYMRDRTDGKGFELGACRELEPFPESLLIDQPAPAPPQVDCCLPGSAARVDHCQCCSRSDGTFGLSRVRCTLSNWR